MAQLSGTVVPVHDGELDDVARCSQVTLVGYGLSQLSRHRRGGVTAITGNHVMIEAGGVIVTLVHLRRRTLQVTVGEQVNERQQLGECGNSGNYTQPHVHVQATNTMDWQTCRGVPMALRHPDGREQIPGENEIVEV